MQRLDRIFFAGLIALAVAGCSGGNNSASGSSASSAPATDTQSAAPSTAAAAGAPAANGASVYATNCASCHQAKGQGVPGAFPPLAGSAVVAGDPKALIHIVKFGLSGTIQVAGHSYNGTMPAWSSQLSDGDIASVITYVRSSWGNKAGAVSVAAVGSVSK